MRGRGERGRGGGEGEEGKGRRGRGGGEGGGPNSVGGDALEPVVVEVEEDHLWLCGLQDEVP